MLTKYIIFDGVCLDRNRICEFGYGRDEESSGSYIVSLLYFGNGLKGYVYHESFETEEQAKQRCEDIMDCLEN